MSNRKFTLQAPSPVQDRADRYLHDLFEESEEIPLLSRSQVQKLIEQGLILVNGLSIKAKDRITEGATIELTLPHRAKSRCNRRIFPWRSSSKIRT